MARSVTIRAIDRRAGKTYIRYGKSEVEIAGGLQEVKDWARAHLPDTDDALAALAIAMYLARDPDATNPGQIVGRTVTLDMTGRVNYPDSVLRVS